MTAISRLFLCIALLLPSLTQADVIYRQRLPFTVTLKTQDQLDVTYDFTQQKGIRCTATKQNVKVDFSYKGRQKNTSLPMVLQSDHIPDNKHEHLADVNGRFTLAIEGFQPKELEFEVTCHYLGQKN